MDSKSCMQQIDKNTSKLLKEILKKVNYRIYRMLHLISGKLQPYYLLLKKLLNLDIRKIEHFGKNLNT